MEYKLWAQHKDESIANLQGVYASFNEALVAFNTFSLFYTDGYVLYINTDAETEAEDYVYST